MGISATTAAVWSAAAATVSAISAFVALSVNRASLRQSVRPELHLLDWSRSVVQRGESAMDTIRIGTLKNVGRGVAMHVHLNIERNMRNSNVPLALMNTTMLPLLAAGETHKAEFEISLIWENVKERKSGKWIAPRISVLCWDTIDRRHQTAFDLFVIDNSRGNSAVAHAIAPGVMLTTRVSSSRAVRTLRLQRLVSRVPGLGWLAPK